ncbi:MAG: prepilin-type N-terminal cleavage/methylation domain-containing protein, partial [Tenericutes bacterium]|nr:prepilin-type N-terminal cleavage/methylation domain-containing protein [Mycoplasmatota bacterium]
MKQKGFTLIELLAVIVILGVILVIAIPSISAAILNARKNAYVATANELVDGLRMKSLTNPEILPTTEEPTCYKPNEIKLEKGSNTRSPFGKDYTDDSQICVTYEESNDYIYSICLVDEGGNGISSNNIATINKSDVKIGEATCDGSGGDISNKEQIATGSSHTVALLEDGTVRAWGNNRDGALGNGSTTNSNIPVTVTGLTNVTQIAAGFNHTVALLADGTVRTWGKNNNGQLGNASWTSSNIPVTVTGLTNVTQIAAGEAHTVALLEDGTVRAWGYNYYGQLGNASWTNSTVPVTVTGLTNVTQIAANG